MGLVGAVGDHRVVAGCPQHRIVIVVVRRHVLKGIDSLLGRLRIRVQDRLGVLIEILSGRGLPGQHSGTQHGIIGRLVDGGDAHAVGAEGDTVPGHLGHGAQEGQLLIQIHAAPVDSASADTLRGGGGIVKAEHIAFRPRDRIPGQLILLQNDPGDGGQRGGSLRDGPAGIEGHVPIDRPAVIWLGALAVHVPAGEEILLRVSGTRNVVSRYAVAALNRYFGPFRSPVSAAVKGHGPGFRLPYGEGLEEADPVCSAVGDLSGHRVAVEQHRGHGFGKRSIAFGIQRHIEPVGVSLGKDALGLVFRSGGAAVADPFGLHDLIALLTLRQRDAGGAVGIRIMGDGHPVPGNQVFRQNDGNRVDGLPCRQRRGEQRHRQDQGQQSRRQSSYGLFHRSLLSVCRGMP